MVPFGDFEYFGLLLYILLPLLILGLLEYSSRIWSMLALGMLLVLQSSGVVSVRPDFKVPELYLILGYAVFQGGIARLLLRPHSKPVFYGAVLMAVSPLLAAKVIPVLSPTTVFGFLGISYVTFRALDVVFSIHDGLIKSFSWRRYLAFLLFVPAFSSGPIDRYRRFVQDWDKRRTRLEFLADLDVAVARLARGFLYKFIIAALIKTYWMDPWSSSRSTAAMLMYMYAYTFYLFFDFAGYSAFAIAVGRFMGVQMPENFDRPFLARNIRDFWNRWHISLSFWFRDHVYMRFLLAASKGKWFKGKHTASYAGLFVTFGIMGIWHGLSFHYIVYGIYHAVALSFYDWFARWNKTRKLLGESVLQLWVNRLVTFHVISFGLLLFSGRLTPPPPPPLEQVMEKADCHEVSGVMWDRASQKAPPLVDFFLDDAFIERRPANEFRQDLKERGYGDGKHGFRFSVPWWVRDGRPHIIEIRDAVQGKALKGAPQTVECERNEEEIQREEQKLRKAREAAEKDATGEGERQKPLPQPAPAQGAQ